MFVLATCHINYTVKLETAMTGQDVVLNLHGADKGRCKILHVSKKNYSNVSFLSVFIFEYKLGSLEVLVCQL